MKEHYPELPRDELGFLFVTFECGNVSGELIAQCQGPSTLAYCELVDHRDGTFTLHITPKEPGLHVLDIQYGGERIPG